MNLKTINNFAVSTVFPYILPMKTTVVLSDPLVVGAKELARKEGSSFAKVVERALQEYLAKKSGKALAPLQENHFQGNGFADSSFEGNWSKLRSAIYEGHGDL